MKKRDRIKRPGRVLPPNYKHVLQLDFFEKLDWRDRLRVLFGYRLEMEMEVLMEHLPGKFKGQMKLKTTPQLKAKKKFTTGTFTEPLTNHKALAGDSL